MKSPKMGRDIRLLFVESALTSFILFMPVAYLLFKNLGMNQFQIGLTQFVFAATLLLFEVPTGYFADRVSRRISNASGDIFIAAAVLIYFVATGFWHAVIAEVLFGIGMSLTGGADSALLKAHAEKQKLSYLKLASRMQSINFVANGIGAIVGGFIGAYNIRWVFLIQAIVFLSAAILAFQIKNAGTMRKTTVHPLKDISSIIRYCLRGHPKLAWRMVLGACLMGSTMMMVWFMTPSFLAAGIDIKFHGLLFAAISIIAIGGSELVGNNRKIHPTTPLLVAAVAYFTLGWQISLATVLIFLLTSFARGINTARVKPYIQEVVPDDIQATAISVYGMLYRVVSSCLVLTVNYIGNFKLSFGLIASGLICIVMWLVFRLNQAKYV